MTHATKAIYKLLLTDYVKVSKVSVEDMLFDEQDINRSMDKIEVSSSCAACFNFLWSADLGLSQILGFHICRPTFDFHKIFLESFTVVNFGF